MRTPSLTQKPTAIVILFSLEFQGYTCLSGRGRFGSAGRKGRGLTNRGILLSVMWSLIVMVVIVAIFT
jgi:hypothetical protein